MSLTKLLRPVLDSRAVDTSMFDDVNVYQKPIEDEVFPEDPQKCFAGAWYRKVMSSSDAWLGIEGIIRLGEFTPDEKRFDLDGNKRYMDNPSVYMGGNAGNESDAGLGLNLTYPTGDTSEELDLSAPKLAYRPFWRYIYDDATDIDNNVMRRSVNSWNIAEPEALMYNYFPGDLLRMKIYAPIKGYLQLRIEVLEPTTIEKYVDIRKKYHLKNDCPSDFYSPIFISEGQGENDSVFKRVNSIDQYGNEGHGAKETDATVKEATWKETWLYREICGELIKVPFSKKRQRAMACPRQEAFTIRTFDEEKGAEAIAIHPGKKE